MTAPDGYVPIMHGEHVAFYFKRAAFAVPYLRSDDALQPDGKPVVPGTLVRCHTCDAYFDWPMALLTARAISESGEQHGENEEACGAQGCAEGAALDGAPRGRAAGEGG